MDVPWSKMRVMSRIERLLHWPIVRSAYRFRFNRQFAAGAVGSFRGIYASFAEALRDAPATKPTGYDHVGPASMYRDRLSRIYPSDYPVLFWLNQLLPSACRRVCDVGGHVGVAFYGFRKYVQLPAELSWTVVDVPAVCEAGRELAAKEGVDGQLKFMSELTAAESADVLLAAGSLQYVEKPLWESLMQLGSAPHTLMINNVPVTPGPRFVTIQNIGVAYCPYLIFNEREFVEGFGKAGYTLRDRWGVATHSCRLPLNPERNVDAYSGFLFTSKQSPLRAG